MPEFTTDLEKLAAALERVADAMLAQAAVEALKYNVTVRDVGSFVRSLKQA